MADGIITQMMVDEFNQDLAQSGAIFRLKLDDDQVSIQPASNIWLYRGGYNGASIINLSDEFYHYLEVFFTKKDASIQLRYNNTRSIFWAYHK